MTRVQKSSARSIELLAKRIDSFAKNCLNGLKANGARIDSRLEKNLMVVAYLFPFIRFDEASEVARRASRTGKTIKETVLEMKLKIKGKPR